MYKREEEIVEENLESEKQSTQPPKEMKVRVPSKIKQEKSFQHNQVGLNDKLALKKEVTSLYTANVALFFIAGIVIIPYILGFVLTYFLFAFY